LYPIDSLGSERMAPLATHDADSLIAAGLPADAAKRWLKALPRKTGGFTADRKVFSAY
jgi:hypothetical protein